ncbi:hypothetical protein PR048_015057 [Dryococelus australis]|uniref:Uncharacterized protein n=1 Tax=Dryococelus australis TaxID=614101 RepID=A0ABQ9HFW3_9NEOP|nr:hypothetical protein PR048_015057 [Dryococelus australis]
MKIRGTGILLYLLHVIGVTPHVIHILNYYTLSYTYDYVAELKGHLQSSHEITCKNSQQNKLNSKTYYDRNVTDITFQAGDQVLLYDESVRRGSSKKLTLAYIGPYEVIEIDGVNALISKSKNKLFKSAPLWYHLLFFSTISLATAVKSINYKIEKYDTSPGLYYENLGHSQLYNTVWRTVTYINLSVIEDEIVMVIRSYDTTGVADIGLELSSCTLLEQHSSTSVGVDDMGGSKEIFSTKSSEDRMVLVRSLEQECGEDKVVDDLRQ